VRSLRDYVEIGGGIAARSARESSPDEIIGVLSASGLRGRGGAGFPTGTKWKTVAASRSSRDITTVVVNAAEGEPGTFKDRALLRTNPYRVLEGAIVAATTMQSDNVRIGIKGTFGREIDRLTTAIAEMRDAGWLHDLDVQLVLGPSSYLFGEETALLEVIEGRQPFPRVTPPYRRGLQEAETRSAVGSRLATIGGGKGAPALVDNVETLANVPLIIERGADWFRQVGTDGSPGTIVATVSGATRRSAVGEVAMGSTLREVIDSVGWGPRPGREISVVLAGTANALIPAALLDTPLTYEAMQAAGTGLGSAGFVVFDDTTEPAAVAAGVLRFLSVESCGQCEPCKSDGLQIAAHLRRSLHEQSTATDVAAFRRRIDTVAIGARCNLAQQQAVISSSLLQLFPNSLGARPHAALPSAMAPVEVAPIEDLVGGRATIDTVQLTKQPDWSYGGDDSGAAPAARLGNTPVHVSGSNRPRVWPEWAASMSTDHPLEIIDDAHEAIDALIDRAMADEEDDLLDAHLRELVVAVRTHVDVTKRVLFPMVRRVGDEAGDRLADAAELQERALLGLVGGIDLANPRRALQDIGVAMHDHAAIGDEILELLRGELDPDERASLADGLAAAQATSTVSRLFRSASTAPVPEPTKPPDPQHEPALDRQAVPAPQLAEAPPVETTPTGCDAAPIELVDPPSVIRHQPKTASALSRMLVGVDGSPAAAAALRWAGRLAERVGAEVLIANVFEPEQAEVSPDDHQKLLAAAEDILIDWAEPLSVSSVRHRCLQLTGPPDSLLTAATSERANLVVVGTRGAGRHAALHLGSLAHYLAHHTVGPLAIVPIGGAATDVDRIVLGIDGSTGSAAAVLWCADVAAAVGAEVLAVCAVEPRARPIFKGDGRWREAAEAAISSEWVAPLRTAGVAVRTRVVDGAHPLAALASAAAEENAGLLVVGTRGLSEIGGVRLGRLPLQLVHHTHLPVVLVPPGGRG
jgi:NADH:ubiquinone oxidoreductase subunit F (NADH-binding)